MKTTKMVERILRDMQANDPNGDWKDAPICRKTIEAMYISLGNWAKEGGFGPAMWLDEMRALHNLLETCIWHHIPITREEYEIFAGYYAESFEDYQLNGSTQVIIGNKDCRVVFED
jgi:hypothetical protein